MFCKAERNHNINMQQSIVIGDKITDIEAGRLAGVGRAFLVNQLLFLMKCQLMFKLQMIY